VSTWSIASKEEETSDDDRETDTPSEEADIDTYQAQ